MHSALAAKAGRSLSPTVSLCPRPPSFFQFVDKSVDKWRTEAQKASVFRRILRCRAEEGIRTPTILLSPAPQAGASASSATSAFRIVLYCGGFCGAGCSTGVAGGVV